MTEPTLALEGVGVQYRSRGNTVQVLRDITLRIAPGEAYGLVGESGCGKSTAAYAIMRYLPRGGRVNAGRILLDGQDMLALGAEGLRHARRSALAMVYQDPGRALNPSLRVGDQLAEVFELAGAQRGRRAGLAADMLARVRIGDPHAVMARYPHQLSGGMQQRVAIAMALASEPQLLILDEPTTGLDATVEADVLDLIRDLRRELSTAILFISHNLGVIAGMCDRVGVLYAGRLVEQGPTAQIFADPRHPYTAGLLRCLPRAGRSKAVAPLDTIPGFLPAAGADTPGCVYAERCRLADDRCRSLDPGPSDLGGRWVRCHHHAHIADLTQTAAPPRARPPAAAAPILALQGVSKTYGHGPAAVRALRDVTLDLAPGETLGLVGESGSGKTTLARVLLGLVGADPGGTLTLDGAPLAPRLAARSRDQVKAVQIVFQNPDSALNRSHTVRRMIGRTIDRLLGLKRAARDSRVIDLIAAVRLTPRHLGMRPRALSGGLKQRVAIARAFAGAPRVVVCDEPTSALDVSVQAAILNLLVDLQTEAQVSYVFISHDLGVVRYLADRIAVLYLGEVMELGPAEAVFAGPHHPYTEALLSAIPRLDGAGPARVKLAGEIPAATRLPTGCVFHTRCPRKLGAICEAEVPPANRIGAGHMVRCHIAPEELPRARGEAQGGPAARRPHPHP